ncbi:hypothetical protein E4634_00595 [Mangrovimicrobium sediminis]|uniref:Exo-alpha-sialidase n=1 Tax=Mangrovimicrobium sediminis TaxID=2562682 RepID=A0A4Z0M8Q5_9GAMM|nr:hypothetical protein [Haliea sp. SAOS-164]TGD76083.1 hypothetical protein E4634_00595 [Haliea sp. SAOS-164]
MGRYLIQCLAVAAAIGVCSQAVNAQAVIRGTSTSLVGASERIISYRNQEHMWQTSDGAQHIIINLGEDSPSGDLAMYTKSGAGDWTAGIKLAATDKASTMDGVLSGNSLHLCYGLASGAVHYARLDYNSTTHTWSQGLNTEVDSASDSTPFTPSIGLDGAGRTWCAYSDQDAATLRIRIKLKYSTDGGMLWSDSNALFASDNLFPSKAAKLVPTTDGMGMVFTDATQVAGEKIISAYWAFLPNTALPTDRWDNELIWTYPASSSRDSDPYGTHYSVVSDGAGNVHVLYTDQLALQMRSRDAVSGTWGAANNLAGPASTAYMQVAVDTDDGELYVLYNWYQQLRVLVSSDGGQSFSDVALLYRPSFGFLDASHPRVETPSYFTSPMHVLNQVKLTTQGGEQEMLMQHLVPTAP